MKVILLQDVARIGKKSEIKDVPDGHALNMLIPRKMAEPATPENLKRLKARGAMLAANQAGEDAAFDALAQKIEGSTLDMEVKASDKGHLFKSIKSDEIAALISEKLGPIVADQVELDEPIKATGEHKVCIALRNKKANFILNVVAK